MSGGKRPATWYRPQRSQLFKLRLFLLYFPGLAMLGYYRWIAPWFGAHHVQRMRYALPRALGASFVKLNRIKVSISGIEQLVPAYSGPRVLVLNHNSRFDAYVLLSFCPFPFRSFWSNKAHVTTERFGVVKKFGEAFNMFFVHDKDNIRNTLAEFRRAEAYVASGQTLSFFPEGGYSSDGVVRNIGASCISLAIRTGALIIPIVLHDTRATFEAPDLSSGSKVVRAVVLAPMSMAGKTSGEAAGVVKQIEALMNAEVMRGRTHIDL